MRNVSEKGKPCFNRLFPRQQIISQYRLLAESARGCESAANITPREMPVKVLLRGFEPEFPEDQPVTFSNDLPESILCIQCTNVSSALYKDPGGHGYCGCCKRMCTTEDGFDCSACDRNFRVERLVLDDTIRREIGKQMVICPNSTKSEPVEIHFSELKTHLYGCSCQSGSGISKPRKQNEAIQPKAMNPQGPAHPPSITSSTLATCTNCQETMPKKSIQQHFHSCLKRPQRGIVDSSTSEVLSQQAQDPCAGEQRPSGKYPVATTIDSAHNSMYHTVNELQSEVRELKETIRRKDTDIEHLNTTVHVLQEDIKSVQIRCETRIATAEKSTEELRIRTCVPTCKTLYRSMMKSAKSYTPRWMACMSPMERRSVNWSNTSPNYT